MKPLYKTRIVIWSEFDPSNNEISYLALEAEEGSAYSPIQTVERILDPSLDPDWDGTDFFDPLSGEDDSETEEE